MHARLLPTIVAPFVIVGCSSDLLTAVPEARLPPVGYTTALDCTLSRGPFP